jgi:20S proteasome alpha/beta subunit
MIASRIIVGGYRKSGAERVSRLQPSGHYGQVNTTHGYLLLDAEEVD